MGDFETGIEVFGFDQVFDGEDLNVGIEIVGIRNVNYTQVFLILKKFFFDFGGIEVIFCGKIKKVVLVEK